MRRLLHRITGYLDCSLTLLQSQLFCFCPPLKFAGYASAFSGRCTISKSSFTLSLILSFDSYWHTMKMQHFPAIVDPLIRLKCWKIIPIFNLVFLNCFRLNFVISDPSMITSPFVGLCNKLITRTRVLFPAPLGPTIPKKSLLC